MQIGWRVSSYLKPFLFKFTFSRLQFHPCQAFIPSSKTHSCGFYSRDDGLNFQPKDRSNSLMVFVLFFFYSTQIFAIITRNRWTPTPFTYFQILNSYSSFHWTWYNQHLSIILKRIWSETHLIFKKLSMNCRSLEPSCFQSTHVTQCRQHKWGESGHRSMSRSFFTQRNPCGNCGGRNDTATDFYLSISGLPLQLSIH